MKWKMIITIIGLLAIGFVGGFFTHRTLVFNRIKHLTPPGIERGMERRLQHVLSPTDEQWKKLQPVIEKYTHELGNKAHQFHIERTNLHDSLNLKLRPLLENWQLERLNTFTERMKSPKKMRKRRNRERMHQ